MAHPLTYLEHPMNVKFMNKLSATVFHNVMAQPGNEYLHQWLLRFFQGGWCDHRADYPEDGDPTSLWCRQAGKMGELHIWCPNRDIFRHPDYPDVLLSNYFDWSIRAISVDNYGEPIPDADHERILVGGLVNHGDLTTPSWSSHT